MIEVILYILIMATSVPAGLLLAWLCDDEIVAYRKYILMTVYSAIILEVLMYVTYFNLVMMLSLLYMILALLTVLVKSRIISKKR